MDVNGLVCAFCAQGIEKTMKKFPATAGVFVSLEHRIVAVELKAGQDITDPALTKAITDAGYKLVSDPSHRHLAVRHCASACLARTRRAADPHDHTEQ